MKNRIINEIARLASQKYQYDFVLNGTKDDYAVPEEMIDTVRGTISTVLGNAILLNTLSNSQADALRRFDAEAARAFSMLPWNSDATAKQILERSEWTELRRAAEDCLQEFSVDVQEWEAAMK